METKRFEKILAALNKNAIINFWILNILFWIVYSLIFLPYAYYVYGNNITKIILALGNVLFGFVVTSIMRLVYHRFSFNRHSFLFLAIVVVIVSFIGVMIWYRLDDLLRITFVGWEKGIKTKSFFQFFYEVAWSTPIFLTWSFLYFALKLWREWDTQRERIEKADALAAKANLDMLRYQLNPHFIFNTLSSLRAMTVKDPLKARDMITKISEFLRYTLVDDAKNEVSLNEEIDAIKNYLEIEKIRLEDQLELSYNIHPLAGEYPVPAFILNPIVENAIKHGTEKNRLLKIEIIANILPDKSLKLELINSGKLVNNKNGDESNGLSIGLANVKQRLSLQYPGNSNFSIEERDGKVFTTIILKRDMHG
ncbi:MAG: histidine kinase [bacterium]